MKLGTLVSVEECMQTEEYVKERGNILIGEHMLVREHVQVGVCMQLQ